MWFWYTNSMYQFWRLISLLFNLDILSINVNIYYVSCTRLFLKKKIDEPSPERTNQARKVKTLKTKIIENFLYKIFFLIYIIYFFLFMSYFHILYDFVKFSCTIWHCTYFEKYELKRLNFVLVWCIIWFCYILIYSKSFLLYETHCKHGCLL